MARVVKILRVSSLFVLLSGPLVAGGGGGIVPVDFDGDGVSSTAEQLLFREWQKDSPEASDEALRTGVWVNGLLDLSGMQGQAAQVLSPNGGGGGVALLSARPDTPVPPFSCADADSTGVVDLTDAIYILNFLFQGGPPPCWVDAPFALKTGQTGCFNSAGLPVPCSGAGEGQDASYVDAVGDIMGLPRRYTVLEDVINHPGEQTVLDRTTGLEWFRDPDMQTQFNWQPAVAQCKTKVFGGKDDWRLPNVEEVLSLCDYGRFVPAVDTTIQADGKALFHFDANDVNKRCWTSTTNMVDLTRPSVSTSTRAT